MKHDLYVNKGIGFSCVCYSPDENFTFYETGEIINLKTNDYFIKIKKFLIDKYVFLPSTLYYWLHLRTGKFVAISIEYLEKL